MKNFILLIGLLMITSIGFPAKKEHVNNIKVIKIKCKPTRFVNCPGYN